MRLALTAADLGVFEWRLDNNEISADAKVNALMTGQTGPLKIDWRDLIVWVHPDDRGELAGIKNRLLQQKETLILQRDGAVHQR